MSQEQLVQAAAQLAKDLRDTRDAYGARAAAVIASTSQFPAKLAEFSSLLTRYENARDRIESAMSGSNPGTGTMLAYLDFSEAADRERPDNWINKVPTGGIYRNYGSGKVAGGRGDPYGPFPGMSCMTESATNGNIAIYGEDIYSIPDVVTFENAFRAGNGEGNILSFSDMGAIEGDTYFSVYKIAQENPGKRRFRLTAKAFGLFDDFITDEVDALMMNGESCYWPKMRREADNRFSLRVNGKYLGATDVQFPGVLQGRFGAWGLFQQDGFGVDGSFRCGLGLAICDKRLENLGTGDYAVPTVRPAYP
jgi:hypothetical protein